MKSISAAAILMISLVGMAVAQEESLGTPGPQDVTAGSLPYTEGKVLCTASVNSSGTLAGGLHSASSARFATGKYHVTFNERCGNVTAVNGFSRWVQVDALGVGEQDGIICSTSDMSGNASGVTVNCTNGMGTHVNASFFLFIAR
jgi:hypothetical protein